jgi:hypothetical protein
MSAELDRSRRSALLLLVVASAAVGCRADGPPTAAQIVLLDPKTLIIEGPDGTLSSTDATTGNVRWRYSPPQDAPTFASLPTRRLVCPLERTPAGALVARYATRLMGIESGNGATLWQRGISSWARGERRCPKATPDSGVLLLGEDGLFLQKLDSSGRDLWRLSFGKLGSALGPPHVLVPSGAALVQTRSFLVSVSPAGTINWVRPR